MVAALSGRQTAMARQRLGADERPQGARGLMRKWVDRIDPATAREAAAQAHWAWVATASNKQLIDDAIDNPSGELAGQSFYEWQRRLDAGMRRIQ